MTWPADANTVLLPPRIASRLAALKGGNAVTDTPTEREAESMLMMPTQPQTCAVGGWIKEYLDRRASMKCSSGPAVNVYLNVRENK